MINRKTTHHHKTKLNKWIDNNVKKIILLLFLCLIILLAFLYDKKSYKIDYNNENQRVSNSINNKEKNYDAIITVLDGEGEEAFTKIWGDLINEGYPICSNLVPNNVGKDGFMDWDTIEALNNIGVEFVFHACAYDKEYNYQLIDDVVDSVEKGIKIMDEHGLNHRLAVWTSGINKDIYNIGKKYFDGGFSNSNSINTVFGEIGNSMNTQYKSNVSNYTYGQLVELINTAINNNGWVILFTRNNSEYMTEDQINIFKKAFEYAKKHNVAVVTASEGYDLYYGNKLGNK